MYFCSRTHPLAVCPISLPQGWLVDLINKFGTLNGFQTLQDRFMSGQALNVQIIAALIKYALKHTTLAALAAG